MHDAWVCDGVYAKKWYLWHIIFGFSVHVRVQKLYIQCVVGFHALCTFLLHIHTMILVYPWRWYATTWNDEISCNAWVCVCVHAENWLIWHIVLDSVFTCPLENDVFDMSLGFTHSILSFFTPIPWCMSNVWNSCQHLHWKLTYSTICFVFHPSLDGFAIVCQLRHVKICIRVCVVNVLLSQWLFALCH